MKKSIILLYGIVAYFVFLIAFLYAIGFVGNIIVPKSIDSGAETTMYSSIFINVILLSVFALQHSIMARPKFKEWFNSIFSQAMERSTYILLSSLALILIYWQWKPITTIVWETENTILSSIITGIFFLGWLIVLLSTFMINHLELFGIAQIFDNLKNKQTPNPKFQTNYLYKLVRHPLMLGFLIAFWATPTMTVGHLLFTLITTIYIFVAVRYLEEKDLKKVIGKKYETYQKEVPMIIPFTKNKR
ncbi:isoprenylcysteine carboxylmethyltransferase family protein [Flavobacteriaceae bacterium S0825]|uniref:methanethiol S-methyltransferase n=1 Tax=Gaetbulibacter sp. S0825 TaxID=2720084 RepID=UPI001431CCCC|nr:methanethiol S-methyltransferase [Gaetbulibacter sp. S0825]MCK0110501.1 isoprenylcysteine carboxylmethyltransferase family protein [Flavobacteriaceae bacterium S0825]NIX66130.1 isoprenylcysteine carboxylmethyltransferase family protein [Gaetbulibacter sp. S0825]